MPRSKLNPIDEHIGRRIRLRRMQLGLSQSALGRSLGISFQQIQKYEKGLNRVGGSRMMQMATALKTDTSFFFDGAPIPQLRHGNGKKSNHDPNAELNAFLATKDGLHMVAAFMRLCSNDKNIAVARKLINLAESLCER